MIGAPKWNGERAVVLGVGVSAIDMDDAVAAIDRWIGERTPNYVCITGVHGVMEAQKDLHLRAIHNRAGMVTPDGMPLVWMGRRLGFSRMQRVYGPDLMRTVTALSPARGYRHFYYGGAPGVAECLAASLKKAHPGLNIVGALCPPFRPLTAEEDAAVVERINAAAPDIVWVGLSTPKQEYWMAGHISRLNAPVLIGVGAAFDFLAGSKKQAPLWMQRNGLEWLFRLSTEPRRLWRRYLRIIPGFIFLICAGSLTSWMSSVASNPAKPT
jgi:N-acetylglucosaminyldiphosphoundecaprenol N-acetyl-beta-D-mannosaminyltransferase